MKHVTLVLIIVAAVLLIVFSSTAWGQAAVTRIDNTVDITPLVEGLATLLIATTTAFAGVAGLWVKARWGIDVDLKHNKILNEALDAGAAFAIAKLQPHTRLEINHDMTRIAAQYVMTGAPKATRRFGLDEKRLSDMAAARLAGMLPLPPDR